MKPNGRAVFNVQILPIDSTFKLFIMRFFISIANLKIAIMSLSLLPQFILS
nr:hypothetical protein [Providencia burhodogranariea]